MLRNPKGLLCTDISAEVKRFHAQLGYEPHFASARIRRFDHQSKKEGLRAMITSKLNALKELLKEYT